MALKKWIKKSDKIIFKNDWWEYHLDNFLLPSGKNGDYHYVHTNGSSMIIPVLENNKIIMVNQYRYLLDKESIEFPCGSVKTGDSYIDTARKELEEETNFISSNIRLLGFFNPYNGVSDEICNVYLAKNLTPGNGLPDDTEEFEIHEFTIPEIDEMIKKNIIWDGMTLAAITIFKNNYKELVL